MHLLLEDGRPERARRVLQALEDVPEGHLESRYFVAFVQGFMASSFGDHRAAADFLGRALAEARRTGHGEYETKARVWLAETQRRSGRHFEALRLWAEPLLPGAAEVSGCDRVEQLNGYGWGLLLAMEAGVRLAAWGVEAPGNLGLDPEPHFRRALELAEAACPPANQAPRTANQYLNLALLAQYRGKPDVAEQLLQQAMATNPEMRTEARCWSSDLRGRVALDRQQAQVALDAYDELDQLARSSASIEFQWRAHYGRARALEELARPVQALEAYEAGRQLRYEHSYLVPIHLGRDDFLAQRTDATGRQLALLLGLGRSRQALELVHSSRARFLRGLGHRERLSSLDPAERATWEERVAQYRQLRVEIEQLQQGEWAAAPQELVQLQACGLELAAAGSLHCLNNEPNHVVNLGLVNPHDAYLQVGNDPAVDLNHVTGGHLATKSVNGIPFVTPLDWQP